MWLIRAERFTLGAFFWLTASRYFTLSSVNTIQDYLQVFTCKSSDNLHILWTGLVSDLQNCGKMNWCFVTLCNTHKNYCIIMPWLVWLSGLSASLWTKMSLVWFPVRAHAWVVGQVPGWECARGDQSMYPHTSPSLSPSLTSHLSKNK